MNTKPAAGKTKRITALRLIRTSDMHAFANFTSDRQRTIDTMSFSVHGPLVPEYNRPPRQQKRSICSASSVWVKSMRIPALKAFNNRERELPDPGPSWTALVELGMRIAPRVLVPGPLQICGERASAVASDQMAAESPEVIPLTPWLLAPGSPGPFLEVGDP
jgi:hypothetical protein